MKDIIKSMDERTWKIYLEQLEDFSANSANLLRYFFDPERSKREDSIPEEARKEFRQFLDNSFDRRMEIVSQLQRERDAVL